MFSYHQLQRAWWEFRVQEVYKGGFAVCVDTHFFDFMPSERFYLGRDGYWYPKGWEVDASVIFSSYEDACWKLVESRYSNRLSRRPSHLRIVARDGALVEAH